MLWAVFTLIAAAAQTARNAMQRELTATLGTVGATHVRFLFGFPFALCFLIGVLVATGRALPQPDLLSGHGFWAACSPNRRHGDHAGGDGRPLLRGHHAYIKTEPVQVALFGLVLLGDK